MKNICVTRFRKATKAILFLLLSVCATSATSRAQATVNTPPLRYSVLPQSTAEWPDSSCSSLFGLGYELESQGPEQVAYDTLQLFLEDCPFYSHGPDRSWQAFGFILGAVSGLPSSGFHDSTKWDNFITFLKSVLYLNPDTNWYCNDVSDMLAGSSYLGDAGKMAVVQYLLGAGKCQSLINSVQQLTIYANDRHQHWLDSIILVSEKDSSGNGNPAWVVDSLVNRDTLSHPFSDTAVPTLQQVGLQILMGQQNVVGGPSTATSSPALISAQLLENPVSGEIGVKFQMGREALVTMELRDILGRSIPISYAKYQLTQAGDHTAEISAPNLPPGTYYLRISTDDGDVITLKLLKQ